MMARNIKLENIWLFLSTRSLGISSTSKNNHKKWIWEELQYVAQYPDGTSIRTLKTKTQFLRRPFQLSVNKVFRAKAEHFGFKMKVLAS